MKRRLLQMGFCLTVFGFCLYSYLEEQNELTKLKMAVPKRGKEIDLIREENRRLSYQVDQFESPSHLMELARQPEYSHLKHPVLKEILTVPEAYAINEAP